MAKDEFIEVNLELIAAHTVKVPMSHCWRLPIVRSANGSHGFRAFTQIGCQGLSASA